MVARKLSLENPILQVRKDSYMEDKVYTEISNLMRSIRKEFQYHADAINYLYGPRPVDLVVSLNVAKAAGVKDPGYIQIADDGAGSTGIYAYAFDPSIEEELFFALHLGHEYDPASDLDITVHWAPADGTVGNVIWGLEYYWVDIDETVGTTTMLEVTVAAPTVAKQTTHSILGIISGTGKNEESILLGRFYRKAADAADTYAADAFAFTLDIHSQQLVE